jgi:DNA-binding NtrC family response regulator
MVVGETTLLLETDARSGIAREVGEVFVLAIAWSADEPSRVGEVAVVPSGTPHVLGRGEGESGEPRVAFHRQRPGIFAACPGLAGAGLSRRQLLVSAEGDGLDVERVGQCEMRINGRQAEKGRLKPGDTLYLRRQLLLLCVRRAPLIPSGRYPVASWGEFGELDAHGILGESPATWRLRERIVFTAKSKTHALLLGPSGTGKELAARAIHAMSNAGSKPFVARNAATLPAGLIDAELFGSARNYPNAGMPERQGLVGQVDGGTLFLDEIAELPLEQQAHLLRMLDAGGEYQRLGESVTRRSDFRLVGATNRDPSILKHDLRARLTSLVELTPLAARREDCPLLARHLLLRASAQSPEIAGRFVTRDAAGRAYPRFSPRFVDYILHQELPSNVRELDAILWKAISEAPDSELLAPAEWKPERASSPSSAPPAATPPPSEPSADDLRAALASVDNSVGKAARVLGLPNRFALYRLMKKHGIGDKSSEPEG